ncbi:MAG TPA: hypothetical protein PLJ11_08480, partial [Methanomassiliicoccales archaeon]|nr:hypothetical protein [Methanomassiliicoccales archaeon]
MPAGPSPDLSEVAIWTFAAALPLMVTLAAARINSTSDYALMAFAVFVLCLVPLGVLCRPRSYAPLVLSLSMGLLLHRALITNYLIGYD